MFRKGDAGLFGGDLPAELKPRLEDLLDEFGKCLKSEVNQRILRRGFVRYMLPCHMVAILDSEMLWVIAQKSLGLTETQFFDRRSKQFSHAQVAELGEWEFGFDDPFVIPFPATLLDQPTSQRRLAIEAIAKSHVESELQRVNAKMNIIQINPIFGPAQYQLDTRLAFVLMPFTDPLTAIYQAIIKPTVEDPQFGLVCRRADDIKSNRAIIQDIWKSICEARVVIADMTDLNPNVMYELGIAHTLGKETILLYQHQDTENKFPFDLCHIRRIEYSNTASGGEDLKQKLLSTLQTVLDVRVKI